MSARALDWPAMGTPVTIHAPDGDVKGTALWRAGSIRWPRGEVKLLSGAGTVTVVPRQGKWVTEANRHPVTIHGRAG